MLLKFHIHVSLLQMFLNNAAGWRALKGQPSEIFDLHFFHYSNLPGVNQWNKIFTILVKISLSYSCVGLKKLTPIPQEIEKFE